MTFFDLIWLTLSAGFCGFGDGIGGIAFMRHILMLNPSWLSRAEEFEVIFTHSIAFSQISGYAQSVVFAGYVGSKLEVLGTELGILGTIIAIICYCAPSVLIVTIILKIGIKLYQSKTFVYAVKYMNLFYIAFICGIGFNFALFIFGKDPFFFTVIAGLACVARLLYKINPVLIVAIGGVCGLFLRA